MGRKQNCSLYLFLYHTLVSFWCYSNLIYQRSRAQTWQRIKTRVLEVPAQRCDCQQPAVRSAETPASCSIPLPPLWRRKHPTCVRQGRLCLRVWACLQAAHPSSLHCFGFGPYHIWPLSLSWSVCKGALELQRLPHPLPARNWKSAAAFPSNITRRNRETKQTDSKINTVEVVTRHLRESCVRCSLSSSKRTRAALLGLLPFVFLTESHRSLSFLPFAHPRTHMWAHARIHVSLCPVPTTPMPLCPVNLLCATSISTALISGFLKGEEVNTAQQCLSNF